MSELSPAALAVVDAYTSTPIKNGAKPALAAAFRAVAKQGEIFFDAYDSPVEAVTIDDLLSIAKELEAQ